MPLPLADEDAFQAWIVSLAREHGWRVFWLPNWMYRLAIASLKRRRRADREWPDRGLPDLILVRGTPIPRLLVWECKTDRGKTSPEQDGWLADFRACGIAARVVRPKDREWIEKELAA